MSEPLDAIYADPDYDWDEYTAIRPIYPQSLYELLFSHHEKAGGGFSRALDVGCGPGTVTEVLCSRPFESVIGSDVNLKQLGITQHRLAPLASKLTLKMSPAENLSWLEEKSIDMVICAEAIHWIQAAKFVREAARVLAPHGTLAIWYYYPTVLIPSSPEATQIHWRTMRDCMSRIVTRDSGLPVVDTLLGAYPSELDHIGFPRELWKNETRLRWNRQERNWYMFDPPTERFDRRGVGSDGYHEEDIDELDFMSREFTISELRQYIVSIRAVQEEDWPEMDKALAEIDRLTVTGERFKVSWVNVLVMATRLP
ncbi:S-adenosyl-L-methionine-dependent methyltransferase [Clavulina sp. PMI_390]|nr:S-adenosyl-L-methionine-dependent methyltransferase [Clavulina sp. PMI_390]